jgi:hypothetical protein
MHKENKGIGPMELIDWQIRVAVAALVRLNRIADLAALALGECIADIHCHGRDPIRTAWNRGVQNFNIETTELHSLNTNIPGATNCRIRCTIIEQAGCTAGFLDQGSLRVRCV